MSYDEFMEHLSNEGYDVNNQVETPHEYHSNSTKKKSSKAVIKNRDVVVTKIMAGVLAGIIAAGTIKVLYDSNSKLFDEKNYNPDSYLIESNVPDYVVKLDNLDTYTQEWSLDGKEYTTLSESQVIDLARHCLDKVEDMLSEVDGLTPMATKKGAFYPEYFNEYYLASIAYAESSYRVATTDGNTLTSSAGAMGLCQLTPDTIDSVNHWLHNVMELEDITFAYEDANDPEKAMTMCVCVNIMNCKNYFKEGKGIYDTLGKDFNLNLQRDMLLYSYNNGTGKTSRDAENGTLLDNIRNSDYVKKVLDKANSLEEKYSELTR